MAAVAHERPRRRLPPVPDLAGSARRRRHACGRCPMMTRMPLSALAGLGLLSSVAGQTLEPTLAIVQPTADVMLRGRTRLEATVVPAATGVRSVTFFVDGQQVCRVEARPFECSWDAGSQPDARSVRVVAQLADGGMLRAT